MAARIRLRTLGWLAAACVGFAAGTATAWVIGPGPAPTADVVPLDFPQRRIAESEWLRAAPARDDIARMIRRPGRR